MNSQERLKLEKPHKKKNQTKKMLRQSNNRLSGPIVPFKSKVNFEFCKFKRYCQGHIESWTHLTTALTVKKLSISGYRACLQNLYIYKKKKDVKYTQINLKLKVGDEGGTTAMTVTETMPYKPARIRKIRSCQNGDSLTSNHQLASFRLSAITAAAEEDDDDKDCIVSKPPVLISGQSSDSLVA